MFNSKQMFKFFLRHVLIIDLQINYLTYSAQIRLFRLNEAIDQSTHALHCCYFINVHNVLFKRLLFCMVHICT